MQASFEEVKVVDDEFVAVAVNARAGGLRRGRHGGEEDCVLASILGGERRNLHNMGNGTFFYMTLSLCAEYEAVTAASRILQELQLRALCVPIMEKHASEKQGEVSTDALPSSA